MLQAVLKMCFTWTLRRNSTFKGDMKSCRFQFLLWFLLHGSSLKHCVISCVFFRWSTRVCFWWVWWGTEAHSPSRCTLFWRTLSSCTTCSTCFSVSVASSSMSSSTVYWWVDFFQVFWRWFFVVFLRGRFFRWLCVCVCVCVCDYVVCVCVCGSKKGRGLCIDSLKYCFIISACIICAFQLVCVCVHVWFLFVLFNLTSVHRQNQTWWSYLPGPLQLKKKKKNVEVCRTGHECD